MSTSPSFNGDAVYHTSDRLFDYPTTNELVEVIARVCSLTAPTLHEDESTKLPAEVSVQIVTV